MARSMNIRIETDELATLERDLRAGPLRVQKAANEVLRKGARLVDAGMKVDAAGHQGNIFGRPGTEFDTPLEKHVSHEMLDPWTAEIGIEKKGAGKLAHIIVHGSVNNAPVYDHTAALRRSIPAIDEMFAEAAEDSVLGRLRRR